MSRNVIHFLVFLFCLSVFFFPFFYCVCFCVCLFVCLTMVNKKKLNITKELLYFCRLFRSLLRFDQNVTKSMKRERVIVNDTWLPHCTRRFCVYRNRVAYHAAIDPDKYLTNSRNFVKQHFVYV